MHFRGLFVHFSSLEASVIMFLVSVAILVLCARWIYVQSTPSNAQKWTRRRQALAPVARTVALDAKATRETLSLRRRRARRRAARAATSAAAERAKFEAIVSELES